MLTWPQFYGCFQTNNYQAILVTDTITTHVIFTYECGGMQWSTSGRNSAVIGFNAGGLYYYNHPLSSTEFMREAVACSGRNVTNIFFTLPITPNARFIVQRRRCLRKYREDVQLLQNTNIRNLAAKLEPCPCSLQQALRDIGRFLRQSSTSYCFISTRPVPYNTTDGIHLQLTQQCCYDERTW